MLPVETNDIIGYSRWANQVTTAIGANGFIVTTVIANDGTVWRMTEPYGAGAFTSWAQLPPLPDCPVLGG